MKRFFTLLFLVVVTCGFWVAALWLPVAQPKNRNAHLTEANHPSLVGLLEDSEVNPLAQNRNMSLPHTTTNTRGQQGLASAAPPLASVSVAGAVGDRAANPSRPEHRAISDEEVEIPTKATPPVATRTKSHVRVTDRQILPRRRFKTRLVQHTKTDQPSSDGNFPVPGELHARLDALGTSHFSEEVNRWAQTVRGELEKLQKCKLSDGSQAQPILLKLSRLATVDAPKVDFEDEHRVHIVRANYGLTRRVAVWQAIVGQSKAKAQVAPIQAGAAEVLHQVALINSSFSSDALRRSWQQYLVLPKLERACQGDLSKNDATRRRLARTFLLRIKSPALSKSQREYLKRLPMKQLQSHLTGWASEPIDLDRLLTDLERFELVNDGRSARLLARSLAAVRWSREDRSVLNDALNTHYRNSNLRVAIAGTLLNRLLPDPKVEEKEVVDEILGADVFSQSRILNRLRLRLVPDRRRWRLGLEAVGQVDSESSSTKGPATFYNEGVSNYRARKLVLVDRRGIRLARARAQANADQTLTDVETDFDSIPLLNLLARGIAINQHDNSQADAKYEVEQRVASMASRRLDREVESHVSRATSQFRRKVISPLQRLELNPQTTDMQTTKHRIIGRYRIAAPHQLSANTPRPLAPGNSWLSVQIHESVLNNVLEQLRLGDRLFTLPELYERVAQTFSRKYLAQKELTEEDVRVRFAKHNAVRITCDGGRVTLTLQFAELRLGRSRVKNFRVQAYFKPVVKGLRAQLTRTDHIEIVGRLRIGQRLLLRPIFAKALPVARTIDLIDPKVARNPKIKDLKISQFEIANGWIGLALAPAPGVRVSLKD